ncbi:MAG: DUF4340 domain-containing protein [Deltaproteobacteria bacterium]|nr:DUF4340 domain-containing protein [Deltaproteobacteria bacterium]
MRPRNTLLLLLVLAALGAYVYWIELPHEKRQAEEKRLLAFDKDKVGTITLEYPDHAIALARGDEHHWRIVKPIEADADDSTVGNLLTAVAEAQVTRTLDDVGDKLGSYGLDPPQTVVKLGLEGGGELPAVKVGKNTQVGFSAYVQKDDEKSVRIIGGALQSGLKKDVKDLRDKTVIGFDEAQARKLVLARPSETITVERQGDADTWRITTPGSYPADAAEIRALLASVRGIRADDFASDEPTPALQTYGLEQPRLTVSVFVGKDEAQQTLLFGATHEEQQKKTLYAKRAEKPTVYAIPEFTLKNVDKDLNTLRDKTILPFDKAKAAKLVVTRKDGAGFTLVKRDGAWHLEAPGAGTERAPTLTRFLEDVAMIKGTDIADEHAPDLAKYGLADPALTIAVSDESGAAVGTLLGTRGTAAGGAPEAEAYATAAASGLVYGIKPFVYDRIDKKAADFREPPATPVPSGALAATPAPAAPALGGDEPEGDAGDADLGDGGDDEDE